MSHIVSKLDQDTEAKKISHEKRAIIKKKATDGGLAIEDEIAESIAKLIRTNVRELEGALTRILAISELQNTRINKKLVNLVLCSKITNRCNGTEFTISSQLPIQ